ncbi:protein kinase [Cetobacterium sp. 8H]|uniref:protein kinase domain-containing protein n=1 Tax=Cetobacterium sp. 8H TaxID=2759681 RepID=UPI00163BD2BA|nr:protein kinase [Cetobacterium sp. 8H]MBC2849952.1 protein kinase [Cetobacterium sp. 8H]
MGKKNIKRSDLVNIATQIVSSFNHLHSKRVLVGNISDNTILIDDNLNIHLIDFDSFQLDRYLCEVGTDEFTLAEMMGKNFKKTPRTLNNEYFSLGVLLLKILIPGRHPFSVTNGGSPIENIKNLYYVAITITSETGKIGLHAFLEILKRFNLDKLVVSGTNLWYGTFYYNLEEGLGMHQMDIANLIL